MNIPQEVIDSARSKLSDRINITFDHMIKQINQFASGMKIEDQQEFINGWVNQSQTMMICVPTGSIVLLSGERGGATMSAEFDRDRFSFLGEDDIAEAEATLFAVLDSITQKEELPV